MIHAQELLFRKKTAEIELKNIRSEALALLPKKIDELAQSYKEYCERQKIEYDFEKRGINLLTPLIHIDNTDDPWETPNVLITALWTDFLEVEPNNDSDPVPIDEVSTTNILLIMSDFEVMIANPFKVTFLRDDE
jgi:hypothetical protein